MADFHDNKNCERKKKNYPPTVIIFANCLHRNRNESYPTIVGPLTQYQYILKDWSSSLPMSEAESLEYIRMLICPWR